MPLDHPGDQHPFHVTPGRGHGHEATRKAHGHDGGVDRETASVSAGWLKRERERERMSGGREVMASWCRCGHLWDPCVKGRICCNFQQYLRWTGVEIVWE